MEINGTALNANGGEASTEPSSHERHVQRFPIRWLAEADGLGSVLGKDAGEELKGVTVESVEVMKSGDLLLLLSAYRSNHGTTKEHRVSLPWSFSQLLVAVGASTGRVQKWWYLSRTSGTDTAASLLGV